MAYGITPENEHHLVAQRDVRQFQVDAELTLGCGAGQGGFWLFSVGCPSRITAGKIWVVTSFSLGAKVMGAQSAS